MDQDPFEISVAPMMDWTDRHYRFFLRLLSPHARLYTEMVTTGAILHGDRDRHLAFDPSEHPIALQLGGSDPDALAECTKIGADYGYDEINLNCGCPSDRVQNGSFGACLMKRPEHVADCIEKMISITSVPVTVKCRIGVDDCDEIPFLMKFISDVKSAGCKTFIIHARKAWLQGLSPKENREIPPLRYDVVGHIKNTHPDLRIIINGGITTIDQVHGFLSPLSLDPSPTGRGKAAPKARQGEGINIFDGVMIGREAYQNPYFMTSLDHALWETPLPERAAIARAMIPYIERQARDLGTPVKSITRHMLGLYQGQRGGRGWRRVLSTEAFKDGVNPRILIENALRHIEDSHENVVNQLDVA